MCKFFALLKLNLSQALAYRGLMMTWSFVSLFALLSSLFLWTAVNPKADKIGSYQIPELASYFFVMFIVELFLNWHLEVPIMNEIRDGKLSHFLLKPMSYLYRKFASALSWRIMSLSFKSILAFFVFMMFRSLFQFPEFTFLKIIYIIASMILGSVVGIFMSACIGFLTFWFLETRAIFDFYYLSRHILGGRDLPLGIFPLWLQGVAFVLPFRYIFSFPIEIYFDKLSSSQILQGFLIQMFWTVVCVFIYKWLWKRGVRKYTAFGN